MPRRFLIAAAISAVTLFPALSTASEDPHAGPAMNYRAIDDRLATGGHFVGHGARQLADDGLELVIDLREAPPEENGRRLKALGVEYVHVPVSWESPTLAQYEAFRDVMKRNSDKRVMVQCAANFRASAMTYLYRVLVDEVSEPAAAADRAAVWPLNENWQQYLDTVIAAQK